MPRSLQTLNDLLKRNAHLLKFSFLALGRPEAGPESRGPERVRLVAPPWKNKGRLLLRGCAGDGEVRAYDLLLRAVHADATRARVRSLERGDVLDLGPLERKGDVLRMGDPAALRPAGSEGAT